MEFIFPFLSMMVVCPILFSCIGMFTNLTVYGVGIGAQIKYKHWVHSSKGTGVMYVGSGRLKNLLPFTLPTPIFWFGGTKEQTKELALAMAKAGDVFRVSEMIQERDYDEAVCVRMYDGRKVWPCRRAAELCNDLEKGWWPAGVDDEIDGSWDPLDNVIEFRRK